VSILAAWRFCPRCAAPIERGEENVTCPECGFVAWANSAPAVQGLVERDGRLLLVRRAIEPGKGKWDIPGGFLQEGEHPHDALRRELREETGLAVEPREFLGAWIDPYEDRFVLGLTYEAIAAPGEPQAADDVASIEWFAPDELPGADEFAFGSHPEVVSLWARRHEHP
jgi:ADP-ribose pyrophosphatase YjhB (NUDIX family)